MAIDVDKVWHGASALEPFLVPIADLEPFPGNPRRGDTSVVAGSLRRFGQLKPIVADGTKIIAGHHVALAAADEGWTHVAVLQHDFGGEANPAREDDQRGFLLADNRASDLGDYDTELLVQHLESLAEIDRLEGTGYSNDDIDSYLAQLRRQLDQDVLPAETPAAPDQQLDLREVVLIYSAAQRDELEALLKIVSKEKGTDGLSETVFAAVRLAAFTINQAPADAPAE